MLDELGIRYLAPADAAKTGLGDGTVDIHFSTDVLEHVEPGALRGIMAEAARIIGPSGVAIHFVNPGDHFAVPGGPITSNNFLRYGAEKWGRIAGNQFGYCNRLRPCTYREVFEQAGLRVARWDVEVDEVALEAVETGALRVDPDFGDFGPDDLSAKRVRALLTTDTRGPGK